MAKIKSAGWSWPGHGSLVEFVVSLNLHRRHLTSSQLSVVALDVEKQLAEEAERERRRRIAESRAGETSQIVEPSDRNSRKSSEQAARITGTNRQYVSDAKKIQAQAPDLLEEVRASAAVHHRHDAEAVAVLHHLVRNPPEDAVEAHEMGERREASGGYPADAGTRWPRPWSAGR